jgi:DEAD/DEAH box helicase domain-containing protein
MRSERGKTTLRCAVYTRVSTEHGLEQEFNSLDNQREASEAYVKSQAHEGWKLIRTHYDDGGYSGGSLERPALQKLLDDVRARRIDVIVVYKVDRLTRSLADFAKLVELFDEHRVSFVSVTQAFNTTTSMGRLTLNVLLSFAQFEREVTGERIRDKIAASIKGFGGGRNSLPNYAPASPKPVFPANVSIPGFEACLSGSSGSWYSAWFDACFGNLFTLDPDVGDFFLRVFDLLQSQGVVERLPIGGKNDEAVAAWGLVPEQVRVFSATSLVRCSACGNSHRVPEKYAALWSGMPCTRAGCRGRMKDAVEPDGARTRARMLTKGRIKRVVAAEHTSMLDREERKLIETRFMQDAGKPWYPNLLSATPTLEMGINIGDLSTLILCSVPPEQANYVQRVGRAGRRDGNAMNVTVATARSHDMWYWADPAEMISGQVKTPAVHLEAVAILRRQFAASTLDRWVAEEGAGVASYGRVGEALKAIKGGVRSRFPLFWFDFIAKNATRLFEEFVKLFLELRDQDSLANLSEFAHGGEKDGLAHLVAEEYRDVEREIASIETRVADNKKASERLKQKKPPDLDQEDRLKDLDRERRALRMIRDEIQKGDNLAFLTDRGILPNYAFPEAGVTLKSVRFPG